MGFLFTKNKSFPQLCTVVHYTPLGQACQLITTFACFTRTHLTWIQQAGQSTYGSSCSLRHPDLQYVQCCVMYNYYTQFTSYKICPLGHKRVGYVLTSYLLLGANSANLISREQGRRAQHLWTFLFTDMSVSLDMSASAYHTTQHLQLSLSVCVTFCLVQILPAWHQALAICTGFLGLRCCLPYNCFQGKILK